MPIAFVTVKLPDGGLIHLDVDLRTRVEEFRSILAPKCGVKRHRQRLVFAGRLLQDGRTLEAYGVERNATIHLLHAQAAGEGPGGADISKIPSSLGALQRHVLQNPDILQQMLESSAMQSLLNDHDFLRSLLKMDPRLNSLMEGTPELQEMLSEAEFMKQASESLRNPVHVRDVLKSTDRAMNLLEGLSGGAFDVLRNMCDDIKRPLEDKEWQEMHNPYGDGKGGKKPKQPPKQPQQERPDETQLPGKDDGERPPSGEGGDEGVGEGAGEGGAGDEAGDVVDDARQPPEWLGTFDLNSMASMLQDQNMQQLLAQMVQTLGGPTGRKVHPDDPFVDAGFLAQMFHSQTISSCVQLQDVIAKLSMAPEPEAQAKSKAAPKKKATAKDEDKDESLAGDSPAVLSGLNPISPACNFKESFGLFLAAEQESPEVRYKGQLQAMANMGFDDKDACIQMLHSCDGNMTRAVEMLMAAKP